ncbi:MAG: DEAD/DEAH box helicase [Lachnospiraceae bacterium]|nr:DEAD/DEAH box helicase [Lachnospiraceae bacterium]
MSEEYTRSEARKLKREAKAKQSSLKKLIDSGNEYEKKTQIDIERHLKKDMEDILKNMSVDELSKAKSGIRVQALKDAGVNNMYRLSRMNYNSIERIKGVGPKSAKLIVDNMEVIKKDIMSNGTIRIDNDNRRGTNDDLVHDVYNVRATKKIAGRAEELFDENDERIKLLIKESAPARSFIRWTFTGKEKRERAIASLKELDSLINGDYAKEVDELFLERQQKLRAKHDDYWKDYENNSAGYFATLERVRRGENEEEELKAAEEVAVKNGLPEELAIAIGGLELDLKGLNCELRRYQEYGVKYIINQGAVLLGDEMGLGKTVEAIASMQAVCNNGGTHFLVVCPASVLINWIREVTKFSDIEVYKIHGKELKGNYASWIDNGGIGVTTYETLDKINLPEDFTYSILVVDEAHYVKNPKAERTQNLLYFRQHTDRVLFMTGTPIENNVEEMCFLLGCLQPDVAKSVLGSTSMALAPDFRSKVSPCYFRRTREDVLAELPDKVEQEEWVELTPAEEKLYGSFVAEDAFVKERQASYLTEDINDSSKLNRLKEIVEEYIENNRKIIVFSFFINTMEKVQQALDGYDIYGPIRGSISSAERQSIIDEFSAHEGGAVLLSQIEAGGTGLNIQAASVIIFTEPQLKPSLETQAIARAYRMGQVNTVMVHRLLNTNTVDERIMDMLKNKQDIFDEFADKSESGEKSVAESQSDRVHEDSKGINKE